MIAIRVLNETKTLRLRSDLEARFEHSLIRRIARTEHHPVFAEGDWSPVAIGRDVPDRQRWHNLSVLRPHHSKIRANMATRDGRLRTTLFDPQSDFPGRTSVKREVQLQQAREIFLMGKALIDQSACLFLRIGLQRPR